MRLFVAIELDAAARRAIAAEQDRLRAAVDDRERSALRWARPEHMHLTLAFLGELTPELGEAVINLMGTPVRGARFAIVFGGLGVFPPRGAPRVLWLGLSQGGQEVIAIQRQVAERLMRVGVALEDRTFHPHLTLARWRESRRADSRTVLAAGRRGAVAQLEVTAVTLIESRPAQAGPTYTALCRARLEEDGPPPLQSMS